MYAVTDLSPVASSQLAEQETLSFLITLSRLFFLSLFIFFSLYLSFLSLNDRYSFYLAIEATDARCPTSFPQYR